MKIRVVGLMMLCGSLVLFASEPELTRRETSTPPPDYDANKEGLVRVSRSEAGAAAAPQPSSSSPNFVFEVFQAVAHYFSPTSPALETKDQAMAREIRLAVVGKKSDALKSLLKTPAGVRCAQLIGPDRLSAFHLAAFNQYIEGIIILHGKKVCIDAANGNGQTALQVALTEGHVVVAEELVKLGSPVQDEEVQLVRNLRKKLGKDNEQVKALADLLAAKKKETILHSIFYTDSEDTEDEAE